MSFNRRARHFQFLFGFKGPALPETFEVTMQAFQFLFGFKKIIKIVGEDEPQVGTFQFLFGFKCGCYRQSSNPMKKR